MKKKVFIVIILLLSNLVFCTYAYIINNLGAMNCFELLYHLTTNIGGVGSFTVLIDAIKSIWYLLIFFPLIEFLVLYDFKTKKPMIGKKILIFSIIFLVLGVFLILNNAKFFEFVKNRLSKTDLFEEYYVDTNNVDIFFDNGKNNLILIYLESMEASLFSTENLGAFEKSRISELEFLAKDNINFSNTDKLGGYFTLDTTSYTSGSIISSTSGTPIYYVKGNEVLPSVRTLYDVLKGNDYNLRYIQGSSIKFGAKDMYLKGHGVDNIIDYDSAKEDGLINKDYYVWWGFEDKKLFNFAKEEISELAKDDKPFAYTLLTVDTHFMDGYLDETCDSSFDDHYSNSYACSSKMVYEFVNWIKTQDFYKDTTIVILGDHQTMQNSFYQDKDYTRTVYDAFINSKISYGNFNNRIVTSFDLYPTILASIGARIEGNRLGLGVNLYSDEETIAEVLGIKEFNEEISKSSDYYENEVY